MKLHLAIYSFLITVFIFGSVICHAQNDIDPNGYNVFYYDNGNVSSEGSMRSGKPDGYWKTYYLNKVIKSEGNRKNFELDSTWSFYNKSGNIAIEINYVKNLGYFMEMEYLCQKSDIKKAIKALTNLLKELERLLLQVKLQLDV